MIDAIVLAAGAGVRMGGPKALLVTPHGPLARLHVDRLREAGCARPIVVTRTDCRTLLDEMLAHDALVVGADTPEPAASLAAALRARPASSIVIITPIDVLPARNDTIAALVAALSEQVLAATPMFEGRGGHPVVCRAELLAPYALDVGSSPPPLRDVLAALEGRRVRIPVDDEAVRTSFDSPSEFERVFGVAPRFANP